MNILTIETTCDETAAAVVTDELEVLASVVASQDALHERFGGVVPEIASRAHVERILPVIDQTLRKAGLRLDDLDAVAVANTPGLAGSLLVGLTAAKTLCLAKGLPLVAVNHLQAHIYACHFDKKGSALFSAKHAASHSGKRVLTPFSVFPCVGLIVSGGHSNLYRCDGPIDFTPLGGTIDDAAGEAFDKVASLLGLPYPGGPAIERAARDGNAKAIRFPRPLLDDPTRLDFSFSGLKTAVRYLVAGPGKSKKRGARSLEQGARSRERGQGTGSRTAARLHAPCSMLHAPLPTSPPASKRRWSTAWSAKRNWPSSGPAIARSASVAAWRPMADSARGWSIRPPSAAMNCTCRPCPYVPTTR